MGRAENKKEKNKPGNPPVSRTPVSAEQRLADAVCVIFTASVLLVPVSSATREEWFFVSAVICCAVSFAIVFAAIYIVSRKSPAGTPAGAVTAPKAEYPARPDDNDVHR